MLEASGGPLSLEINPARFNQVLSVRGMAKATFNWQTGCDLVRQQPYLVIIKAKDNNSELQLIDSKNLEFYIHAPAPENPAADPGSSSIKISWDPCACANISGYRVYRRIGSREFQPGPCDTGLPDELGYHLIAELKDHSTYKQNQNCNIKKNPKRN